MSRRFGLTVTLVKIATGIPMVWLEFQQVETSVLIWTVGIELHPWTSGLTKFGYVLRSKNFHFQNKKNKSKLLLLLLLLCNTVCLYIYIWYSLVIPFDILCCYVTIIKEQQYNNKSHWMLSRNSLGLSVKKGFSVEHLDITIDSFEVEIMLRAWSFSTARMPI